MTNDLRVAVVGAGLMGADHVGRIATTIAGATVAAVVERFEREAQAAGVPAWRLEQQQQRWLNARANAAREAPWAVRDVYAARIAELRDMSRSRQQEF